MSALPRLSSLCTLLLLANLAQAQYKVIGPDGKVTYTDRPPAADAGRVQPLNLSGGGSLDTAGLPSELRQPVARFPVTLYAAASCAPCDVGRNLLIQRGIPFLEKRIDTAADAAALERLMGARTLPALSIGNQKFKSLSTAEWQTYLDAAGYPAESRLPPSYRRPPASPLAPAAAPATPAPAAPAEPEAGAPATPRNGPDIRF